MWRKLASAKALLSVAALFIVISPAAHAATYTYSNSNTSPW